MTFYERYTNGEYEKVYQEIEALGEEAFLPSNLPEIEKVLVETFQRTSHNLALIHAELNQVGYRFFKHPLVKPLSNTKELLHQLDNAIEPFGFLPLSLKMFYSIVGSVDFRWNYESYPSILWEEADPIEIGGLKGLVEEYTDKDYLEQLAEEYEEDGFISLMLAADYLTKDNISGGPAYAIKINSRPSVDSLFLNEEHDTTFINYLRICFEGAGFSRIDYIDVDGNFNKFFNRVRPLLKPI